MTGKRKKDKLKQDKHQKHQKQAHEKKLKEKELGKIHGGVAKRNDIRLLNIKF
jgi:hypothetical protein